MDLGLKDRRVLVTGGSKGIGLATAIAFGNEGAKIVIAARDEAALDQAAGRIRDQCGVQVESFSADLAEDQERERARSWR